MNNNLQKPGISDDRGTALLAGYITDDLKPDARQELLRQIRTEPQMAETAGAELAMDRLLRFALNRQQENVDFVRGVRMRITAARDGENFVGAVAKTIQKNRPDNRRFWWKKVMPLAAAAAVVLGLYGVQAWQVNQSEQAVVATVAEVSGKTSEIGSSGGTHWKKAIIGAKLGLFDALRVGAKGDVKLVYADGSKIVALPDTEMVLAADVKKRMFGLVQRCDAKRIQLAAGQLVAQVAKQKSGQEMVLTTPHAKATVVGTSFILEEHADRTKLHVLDGTVRLTELAGGKEIEVTAGCFAEAGPGLELKAVPAPGAPMDMVAHWKFDESRGTTAADATANNNGTLQGGATWCPDGKINGALALDGVTGYMDAGRGAGLNVTGAVTVTAWIKLSAAGLDQKILGREDGIAGGYKLGVYTNNEVEFEVHGLGYRWFYIRDVKGGTILTTGVWYHVAGVYSQADGYIQTYVNGLPDRQLLTPGVLTGSAGTLMIGREPFDAIYYWNGLLDDVRVYNRALAVAEIATLAATKTQ